MNLTNISNLELSDSVKETLTEIKELFEKKSLEYGGGFHNFVQAGILNNEDPRLSLHGFLTKHLISYLDDIHNIKQGFNTWTHEQAKEKTRDIIVYFLLYEQMTKYLNEQDDLPF